MKFSKSVLTIGIIIAVILLVLIGFNLVGNASKNPGEYDNFARCLADSGVKMYGAYWCPHCNNQKQMFGNSWQYVNYIECSLPNKAGQTEVCNQAGIRAYPTWEFQDNKRFEGELTFEQLSQYSNCKLKGEI